MVAPEDQPAQPDDEYDYDYDSDFNSDDYYEVGEAATATVASVVATVGEQWGLTPEGCAEVAARFRRHD